MEKLIGYQTVQNLDRRHKWELIKERKLFEETYRISWQRCRVCGKKLRLVSWGAAFVDHLSRKFSVPVEKRFVYKPQSKNDRLEAEISVLWTCLSGAAWILGYRWDSEFNTWEEPNQMEGEKP